MQAAFKTIQANYLEEICHLLQFLALSKTKKFASSMLESGNYKNFRNISLILLNNINWLVLASK